jgi:Uma2 family endonuclease
MQMEEPFMPSPRKSEKTFTYADYAAWPEDERWELIDGVPYDMTPAPNRTHSLISKGCLKTLYDYFEGKPCEVHHAPFDVRLPEKEGKDEKNEKDESIKTVVQPDVLVVCDQDKLDEKGCRGAPDLVIEILSPSTASKDCLTKRHVYEKHGVRELIIIDPTNRLVQVYVLEKKGKFAPTQMFADHERVASAIFPGLIFDLTKIFPALPKIVRESPRKYLSQRK